MPQTPPGTSTGGILVMIDFPSDIGFAIRHCVGAFYDMALDVTGDPQAVHFCFQSLSTPSTALPDGFGNLLAFDRLHYTPESADRLNAYVAAHDIRTVFSLDLRVEAPFLAGLRAHGVRRIVSYWGAPMSSENSGPRLLAKRLEVRLRRSRPDLFIFESRAMQRLGVGGRGIPEADTCVIPTGVDLSRFESVSERRHVVYERFAIPADRKIVVFMGHLHRRKGVDVLLRAIPLVARLHFGEQVHFLFLGSRPEEEKEFADLIPSDRSHLTFGGYHQDVPSLLAGCYVGCIPSSGWDSFPMSSLEMQACGLPVIVSDLQGTPETVESEVSGIIVPTGDAERLAKAIVRIVGDEALRKRMSVAAAGRIRRELTRDHWVRALAARLRDTIRGATD